MYGKPFKSEHWEGRAVGTNLLGGGAGIGEEPEENQDLCSEPLVAARAGVPKSGGMCKIVTILNEKHKESHLRLK